MTKKVLLIRPENIFNYNNYPSLGLISVATALRSAGYDVEIINCATQESHMTAIGEKIKDCLFAGITLSTAEAPSAYSIMKFIKENSKTPVVAGGCHCTLFPEQMADCGYVDYVVTGEGEEHIVKLAGMIASGAVVKEKIFRQKILDLDTLPMPDYDTYPNIEKFINNPLTDKLSEYVKKPIRWLPYESSRGCPSTCAFCVNVVTGNTRYRKKGAGKVVREIEHIVRKYKLSHLKIIDDNFFVDINRTRMIAQGIIESGLRFTWDGECRADYFNDRMLNDETLDALKKAGLIQLTIGIESGSKYSLDLMRKGITPEQGEYAIKRCNQFGIIARTSFIIEIPGERMEDIKKTIAFINRLRRYSLFTCGVQIFRPYPKCELTERLIQEGHFYEPKKFTEWTDAGLIRMYVQNQYPRPWHINSSYSVTAARYATIESAVYLGNHQITRKSDRLKNSLFINLAKMRNRTGFYKLPVDMRMYDNFLEDFFRKEKIAGRQ